MAKEIDNLAKDAMAAQAAHMSYGNWKALHPETKDKDVDRPALPGTKLCPECQRWFATRDKRKKYCSEDCAIAAYYRRANEYNHRNKKGEERNDTE